MSLFYVKMCKLYLEKKSLKMLGILYHLNSRNPIFRLLTRILLYGNCTILVNNSCFVAGGWWNVKEFDEIHGGVAIEIGTMRYIQGRDNGLFTLGPPHEIGKCVYFSRLSQEVYH